MTRKETAPLMPSSFEDMMLTQIEWAHEYNAYGRLGGSPEALEQLLGPAWREYRRTGRIPEWCGVDLLRGWAFYLTRADHHHGGYDLAESGPMVDEWTAVLDRIASHEDATGPDIPPTQNSTSRGTGTRQQITLTVAGWPPAKNEAKSLLAPGHPHADRVKALLQAAQQATLDRTDRVIFGSRPIGIELTIASPSQPPADATNFLGGVGDVLEARARPGLQEHLGELAGVGLYNNDSQIHEVAYRWRRRAAPVGYIVRLWELDT